jgi:xanthine dehydrogenase small subunit
MVSFILNNQLVFSDKPSGSSLLDFVRYEMNLPGTKSGCREGDCGACTVLEGTLQKDMVDYKSIVSCLTPLANAHGRHIVTVEGLSMKHLSPVQEAIVNNSATQCGFCTPGLVMSLTAHSVSSEQSTKQAAIAAVSGNICRCTGYKSIEKAANDISDLLKDRSIENPIQWLISKQFLPEYFLTIPDRLAEIANADTSSSPYELFLSGGTDLMVQKAEELAERNIVTFQGREDMKGIRLEGDRCIIGAAATANEIAQSPEMKELLPGILSYFKLISSEPIRNMGTIAGNIANASPVGDLTIFFLALDADVIVKSSSGNRSVPLKNFFTGYKKLNKQSGEFISAIEFPLPAKPVLFSFEKVSKRAHLDIASVCSAIQIKMDGERISGCSISAGGVSPIPLYLAKTSGYLIGKKISGDVIILAAGIMQGEISPISDIRGTSGYKRLLLRQLFFAHFLKLFPGILNLNDITENI